MLDAPRIRLRHRHCLENQPAVRAKHSPKRSSKPAASLPPPALSGISPPAPPAVGAAKLTPHSSRAAKAAPTILIKLMPARAAGLGYLGAPAPPHPPLCPLAASIDSAGWPKRSKMSSKAAPERALRAYLLPRPLKSCVEGPTRGCDRGRAVSQPPDRPQGRKTALGGHNRGWHDCGWHDLAADGMISRVPKMPLPCWIYFSTLARPREKRCGRT